MSLSRSADILSLTGSRFREYPSSGGEFAFSRSAVCRAMSRFSRVRVGIMHNLKEIFPEGSVHPGTCGVFVIQLRKYYLS